MTLKICSTPQMSCFGIKFKDTFIAKSKSDILTKPEFEMLTKSFYRYDPIAYDKGLKRVQN
jgi:hypothetical protein